MIDNALYMSVLFPVPECNTSLTIPKVARLRSIFREFPLLYFTGFVSTLSRYISSHNILLTKDNRIAFAASLVL